MKSISQYSACVALLLAATGTAANAQAGGTWRATGTQNRPRQAIERRPQSVVIVTPAPQYQPIYTNPYAYPVAYTVIPAVVMSDGSVWADFGYGYVPVSRACAVATTSLNTQPTVIAGNGFVISGPAPTYMQPAPAQQTASQQMLSSAQANSLTSVQISAAQSACYSRDANGRFFVIR